MKWLKQLPPLALGMVMVGALAQENWVIVSRSKTMTFEARAGSLEQTLTEGTREPIVTLIFRVRNSAKATVEFEKNYVRLADCRAGFGKLVTTDLNGLAKYDSEFMFDGGNVASTIAQTLCALANISPESRPSNITPGQSY